MRAGLKGDCSLQTATFRPIALIYPNQRCQQHTGEQSNLVPFVCCQATSALKLLMSVCLHVCEHGPHCVCPPHQSYTSCFIIASICLMVSWNAPTRPNLAKSQPFQSGGPEDFQTDYILNSPPPPHCQPLCNISNLPFKKRLRNGTKFNQPSSVLHNKARAEFRTHFNYLSWTDPDRCACTTAHFILILLLLHMLEWSGWFRVSHQTNVFGWWDEKGLAGGKRVQALGKTLIKCGLEARTISVGDHANQSPTVPLLLTTQQPRWRPTGNYNDSMRFYCSNTDRPKDPKQGFNFFLPLYSHASQNRFQHNLFFQDLPV